MNKRKAVAYLIISALLWSTGGILIKNIDQSPLVIAGARSGIAALVILLYVRRHSPKITFTVSKSVGSLMYMLMVVLYVIANKMTTPANAILLQFTAPIWVALMARWFLDEKIRVHDWLAIAVVISGLALFFLEDLSFNWLLGNSLAVLSGVALAGVLISLKKQSENSAVEVTFLGNALTFAVCVFFIFRAQLSGSDLLYLAVLGTLQLGVSYIIYAIAVQYVSAVEAILILVIEPILNPIWVYVFSGEGLSINALIGGAIVIITITLRGLLPYWQELKAKSVSSN